jgi:two-component system, sensor histidine kinase PhcS
MRKLNVGDSRSPRRRPLMSDPVLMKRFRLEDRTITMRNVRALCRIAILLVPLACVLDFLVYPKFIGQFASLRGLCSALLLLLYFLGRTRFGIKNYRILTVLVPMLPAFFISIMISIAGDPSSPYYAGLTLCLVAIALMFHWTLAESLVSVFCTLFFYLCACLPTIVNGVNKEVWAMFSNNLVFIVLNSIVIVGGCYYHHKIRLREFLTRAESEIQRHELSRRNQALIQTLKQLRETETQLLQSEKLASLGRMSAGIIHEINNPLNFTNQALFVLKKRGRDLPEEMQEPFERTVNDIKEGIARVSSIVSDLRSFSHPVTGSFSPMGLNELVENSVRLMANSLRDGDVRCDVDLKQELLVSVDRNQMIQVMINLIQNGIDAMKQSVTRVLFLRSYAEGERAFFVMRDNGYGIPEENLQRIFDPFFTTKEVGAGMGMGLAVCFRIVHSMNGSIEARNHPQGGAEFVIALPLVSQEMAISA